MTKQEFSKLLDEKLGGITTDISAIEARVATIEKGMITRLDLIEIKSGLGLLEKRLTAVEGKLAKTATKQDLEKLEAWVAKIEKTMATKSDLKAMVTKKQFSTMEKRIIKKLNIIVDHFDKEGIETEARIKRIERHFGFATV